MTKILMVGPNTDESAGNKNWGSPPFGCHRIAAWLRKHGHEADVYDCNIHNDFEERVSAGVDIIGFSCLQVTLANDIRRMWEARKLAPKALIVAGGIEATLNFQEILDNAPTDLIILAEGEAAMLELANGADPSTVIGTVHKRIRPAITSKELWEYWKAIEFDKLGYDKYWTEMRKKHPDDYHTEGGDTLRLITASHCNKGCTFCSVRLWHERACGGIVAPAFLKAKLVWKLIQKAKQQLPTMESVYFVEDDFIQNRHRAWEFFELTKDSGIRFQIQTHTSRLVRDGEVDTELIRQMADGGCRHITMGVENCSERVLKTLNKPQRLKLVPGMIEACTQNDIRPYILIILFCPEINVEELRENYITLTDWMNMGATVSLEPNLRCYRGTFYWSSDYDMKYVTEEIIGDKRLRYPTKVLPRRGSVRRIQAEFNRQWPDFLESRKVAHEFKGGTGKLMVELLGKILNRSNKKL